MRIRHHERDPATTVLWVREVELGTEAFHMKPLALVMAYRRNLHRALNDVELAGDSLRGIVPQEN
jgi:hypothetical protein